MFGEKPRKKRFANRVRTGCTSCRIRHIKCDETYPVCKKCLSHGVSCHYALRWRAPQIDLDANGVDGDVDGTAAPVPIQVKPREWDLMQGIHFFATALPIIYTVPPDTSHEAMRVMMHRLLSNGAAPCFLGVMMRHQICTLYAARGVTAVHPRALPGTRHLWSRMYEYMSDALVLVNASLTKDMPVGFVLARIMDVMSVEVAILDSPWRAHLRGFLTVIKLHGGVNAVYSTPKPPFLALQFGLIIGAISNTVSPVYDQVSDINNWSDADVLRVYNLMYFDGFCCPSVIFLAIHHTTQLRVAVAAADSALPLPAGLFSSACKIAEEIHDFSPSLWTETYKIPPQPLIAHFGRVYQAAAALYALLSLPRALARVFSGASSTEGDKAARWRQRALLFQTVEEARGPLASLGCGTWPLAVLGAAYHDGLLEEQAAIIQLLRETHARTPNADCGAGAMVRDLAEFWASGKTGWEDCFYKSSHALT
ncbi:C6 zinc finger domain protein [Akanthomyces lecanii RCEF 1005]|uniref:C6 zinc finger domain protein n=1 Tax=Akanthomyces lecanii RCEF 1005 TaxID=1081108 RepID=A0A167NV05_CORDF|nr:C6 zinc finger domain protein [Akanthomyces lecanii RCEF 1005]